MKENIFRAPLATVTISKSNIGSFALIHVNFCSTAKPKQPNMIVIFDTNRDENGNVSLLSLN